MLSTLLRRAGEGGFLSGCRLRGRGGGELTVSHLLFADDTIIFCEARKAQLTNLSWILAWFEAASGLRINLAKSVLIPVEEVDELEELAVELGCRLGAVKRKMSITFFLHCIVVKTLWEIVLAIFGVQWVFPESVKEVLFSWRGSFVGKKRKKIWNSIPLCIF